MKFKNYQNAEMVKYWKTNEFVEAKKYRHPDGHYLMQMQGEKYPFPGHPRGALLYGKLSPLKHWLKNKIFNETWALLDSGDDEKIEAHLEEAWPIVFSYAEAAKYDMLPLEALQPTIKELHRAMTVVGVDKRLVDTLCFIFEEDDAYRMRFQWLAKFNPTTRERFDYAMNMLEHAEPIGDMKERVRLIKRVILAIGNYKFDNFLRELNWKKFGLSKADKYFFRAKYFKVDYPEYQY